MIPCLIALLTFNLYGASFDEELKNLDLEERESSLKSPNMIFENFNFRIGQDGNQDRSIEDQDFEYTFRFKPVSIGGHSLRQNYFANQKARFKLIRQKYKSTKLSHLYKSYLKNVFQKLELKEREKFKSILRAQVKISKSEINRGQESVSGLVEAEKKSFENDMRIAHIQKDLKKMDKDFESASIGQLKDLEIIKSEVNELENYKFDDLSLEELRLEKSDLDLKMEIDQRDKYLDFIEFQVARTQIFENFFDKRFVMKLSFNIPSFKNEHLGINEEKIALIHAKADNLRETKEIEGEIAEKKRKLLGYLETTLMIENSSFYKNSKKYVELYQKQSVASAARLADLKESIQSATIELINGKYNTYLTYIELLGMSGKLAKNASKNVLKESL